MYRADTTVRRLAWLKRRTLAGEKFKHLLLQEAFLDHTSSNQVNHFSEELSACYGLLQGNFAIHSIFPSTARQGVAWI